MKILIPAAGLGTRLRPHTHHRPKPLIHVAGGTVLGHVLERLAGLEIEEVIFIIGHLGGEIERYVAERYDFATRYFVQDELLGQAHAISLAREALDGPLLIVFVDTLVDADVDGLGALEADGVIYVHEVEDPSRFGVVRVGRDRVISELVEKPDEHVSNLAVVGLYYVQDGRQLVAAIDELMARQVKTKGEYYLADALQLMIDGGARFLARPAAVWQDCGTRAALLSTNRYLLEQLLPTAPQDLGDSAVVVAPAVIGAGTEIVDSVIGPHVHIGAGCRLSGSVVGPYASLDDGVQVTDSLLQDVIVEHEAHIRSAALAQSIVGAKTRIVGHFQRLNLGDSSEIELAGGLSVGLRSKKPWRQSHAESD